MNILNETKMAISLLERTAQRNKWKVLLKANGHQYTRTFITTGNNKPTLQHVLLSSLDFAYNLRFGDSVEELQEGTEFLTRSQAETLYKLAKQSHDGLTRLYGPNYKRIIKEALAPQFRNVAMYV